MKDRLGGTLLIGIVWACLSSPAAGELGAQPADTTVAMAPDGTLDVRLEDGTVRVIGWDRDEMRATARSDEDPSVRLSLEREAGSIRLRPGTRSADDEFDEDAEMDLEIRLPRSAALRVHGPDVQIRVEGVDGRIEAKSQDGDVRVSGGRGTERLVSVRSGDGDLDLRDLQGRVEAFTIDGDVRLTAVEGDVEAESVDGDLILRDVSSSHVTARTTDGDVEFEGELRDGGRYRISTHDGDVRFRMAGAAGADLQVTVYEGELVTDLPARLVGGVRRSGGHRQYTLTVGGGGASVSLESFDGTVRILGAGSGGG